MFMHEKPSDTTVCHLRVPLYAKPVEVNSANEENAPKAVEEEPEKIESISIETDREDGEEANPSVAPPVDNSTAVPSFFY
ncbi:hypothetical protein PVK06_001904 [Gossypium arboreum]|uniref:Uncharacterized protein n=1 Tax=Gossypium arboreum TaxID=29729 RepID=A0ABR0R2B6_GOSAR|nr:hypothetical protein PVK06_001904 [Gossypium arboreum]